MGILLINMAVYPLDGTSSFLFPLDGRRGQKDFIGKALQQIMLCGPFQAFQTPKKPIDSSLSRRLRNAAFVRKPHLAHRAPRTLAPHSRLDHQRRLVRPAHAADVQHGIPAQTCEGVSIMIFLCGYGVLFVGNLINGEKPTVLGNAVRTFGYSLMGTSVLLLIGSFMP